MRVFIWPYRAVCLKGWCTSGFYNAASAVVRDFTRTDITGGRLHSVIIAFNCRIPNFHNGLAWRFTAKRRTGRTKIFGVLSGDVYHRIRYNRRLVALLGVVNIGRRVFINRGGVFCALKKCSPTSARILFDWRRLLDQTGLRIDHPDILVAVWRLAGLAFLLSFRFLPGALYVLFLLVTDAFADAWFQMVALGGVFAELAVKNILAIPSIVGFIIAVMITYASRIRDGGWRIFAVIVAAGLLLWMIMLIKTSEWAYSQPAFGRGRRCFCRAFVFW